MQMSVGTVGSGTFCCFHWMEDSVSDSSYCSLRKGHVAVTWLATAAFPVHQLAAIRLCMPLSDWPG